MASPIVWGLGFAGSGIDTASVLPVYTSAATVWLNSNGGSDANAGTEPELPVATIAQAITNVAAGGVICIAAGHAQSIVGTQAIAKAGVRFVGFGTGSNRPKFTPTSGATLMFNVTANNVVFESLYFGSAAGTAGTGGRASTANVGTQFLSCQFDCGTFDGECLLFTNTAAAGGRIENSAFTAVSSRPTRALVHSAVIDNFTMNGCTFDGATFGWAGAACVPTGATNLVIKNLTLAGNADLIAAVTSYQIFGVTTSGAGRVQIT